MLTPQPITQNEHDSHPLRPWEALVLGAVGNTIEFWGFKRNHGRLWAILYLRDTALNATELQDVLDLSKGAVSMLTRELEQWRVIQRVRSPHDASWSFEARTNLMEMITRVLQQRESDLVTRVLDDLHEAETLASEDPSTPADVLQRIRRMRTLAEIVASALSTLIKTATLDFRGALGLLAGRRAREGDDDD